MSKWFGFFAAVFILIFSLSAFGQGEEFESVSSSGLTAVSLPSGALRIFPSHVPTEVDQTLDKLVEQGGGKLRRGDTEVLAWTGSELKKTGSRTIVNRLTDTLKVAGWKYEVAGSENGVTIFSILRDGTKRRAIIGFYGESDGTLVFAWTELESNEAVLSNAAPSSSTGTAGGALPGYEFPTPAGWSRSDSSDKIVLSRDDDKMLVFLPLMDSSGNLESDADRILWQVLKGYNTWYGNGFEPDWGTFERGKTIQGLEYFQAYRYAKKASDPNEGIIHSRFDAVILVVKLGEKVAAVVGRQPYQTSYHTDSSVAAIDRILYDLRFKNAPDNYNLKGDMLGSWSAASTTVALAYTFNANGSFNKGAAIEFRTSRDRYTDNVTTTSYGMTDRYSLAGNILTQNYKSTGQVVKQKIRVYETKYNKDPWKQKLGLLPLGDNPSGETIVMSKSE